MHKIKLIGPKYLTAPLALLGLEIYPADTELEAKKALQAITEKKEAALIFIIERLAVDLQEEIDLLNKRPDITVALIPDNRGQTGLAADRINKLVRHAIGTEIIGRK